MHAKTDPEATSLDVSYPAKSPVGLSTRTSPGNKALASKDAPKKAPVKAVKLVG